MSLQRMTSAFSDAIANMYKIPKIKSELDSYDEKAMNLIRTVFYHPDNALHIINTFAELQSQTSNTILSIIKMMDYAKIFASAFNSNLVSVLSSKTEQLNTPLKIISYITFLTTSLSTITIMNRFIQRIGKPSGLTRFISTAYLIPILKTLKVNTNDPDVLKIVNDPKVLASMFVSSFIFEGGKLAAERLGILKVYLITVSVQDIMLELTDKSINLSTVKISKVTIRLITRTIGALIPRGSPQSFLFTLLTESSIPIIAVIVMTRMKK